VNLDKDFREFIECLHVHNVRYLIVGGYAVGAHGLPRATKDLDVWVLADRENAEGVMSALNDFGFGGLGLSADDFLRDDVVVQLGYPPLRIDILTSVDGIEFVDAYPRRMESPVAGINIAFLGREDLIANKRAAGRSQDIADANRLEGGE
jgi:hypothetical protein